MLQQCKLLARSPYLLLLRKCLLLLDQGLLLLLHEHLLQLYHAMLKPHRTPQPSNDGNLLCHQALQ